MESYSYINLKVGDLLLVTPAFIEAMRLSNMYTKQDTEAVLVAINENSGVYTVSCDRLDSLNQQRFLTRNTQMLQEMRDAWLKMKAKQDEDYIP